MADRLGGRVYYPADGDDHALITQSVGHGVWFWTLSIRDGEIIRKPGEEER